MFHGEDRELMAVAMRLIEACAALPMDDRLLVVQLAWTILAQQARNEALAFPGGFQAERDRQAAQLEQVALVVREDTPDIELERLLQEGDTEGVLRHIRKRMDGAKGGA